MGVENLKVVATITNTGDETLKILNDPRSLLSKRPANKFSITDARGARPAFTGIKVKYSPETAARMGAFTVLEPGASIDVTHDRSHYLLLYHLPPNFDCPRQCHRVTILPPLELVLTILKPMAPSTSSRITTRSALFTPMPPKQPTLRRLSETWLWSDVANLPLDYPNVQHSSAARLRGKLEP